MSVSKQLLDFYINSSIHVALSVCSLVGITHFVFRISTDEAVVYFAFFGTIVGYNFVKYDALARTQKLQMKSQLKIITVLSFLSLLASGYFYFQLQRTTQIIGIGVLALTLLYTLPFFPNKQNARNWAGFKIYIVALCWVGVTVFLPLINAGLPINTGVFLVAVQRFIVVFVLILIFEIIDLQNDDPHLKTVPQQIGVKQTKILGYFLLVIFCLLQLVTNTTDRSSLIFEVVIASVITLFLKFSNEKQSNYYTSFWVESIPILWWILVFFE
jgi:hypothetical protein